MADRIDDYVARIPHSTGPSCGVGAFMFLTRTLNPALRVSECVGEPRVEFGVAQHIGVLAGTR